MFSFSEMHEIFEGKLMSDNDDWKNDFLILTALKKKILMLLIKVLMNFSRIKLNIYRLVNCFNRSLRTIFCSTWKI